MGQSYDRPGGGRGAGTLPKPTPPPRKAEFRDDPTQQEPAARLPPISAPPRKIGSVPEMSVYSGLANERPAPPKPTLSGGFGPLPAPSAPPGRASLPAVSPPPRRPLDSLGETVTKIRSDAPPAADTIRNGVHDAPTLNPESEELAADGLDWEEEEESTHVFGNGSSPPPADQAASTRSSLPGTRPSSASMSSIPGAPLSARQPRLVPPSPPSKATLLGVHPSELSGSGRAAPGPASWPAPSATGFPAPSVRPPTPSLNGGVGNGSVANGSVANGSVANGSVANGSVANGSVANGGAGPAAHPSGVLVQPELGDEQATAPRDGARAPANGYPSSNGSFNGAYANGAHGYEASAPAFPPVDEPGFTRLPSGRVNSPTEMALRRPTLPLTALEPTASHDRGSKRMALGIAVATAVITATAASAFLLVRRPGTLQVEVRDPKGTTVAVAEVYVDGKKVCESSPCIVRDLEAGPRSVRVVANGFANEEPTTVDVGSGTITTLPVSLRAAQGTLIAASDQPGLRVFVDGTERGPLPARLTDIAPGSHEIRIAGGDRYKPLEKTVDAKAGEPIDLGNVRLTVIRGKITVSLKTDGASITLIPNDDTSKAKVLDGPFPRAIEVETQSGTWKLVAKKKGLPDFVAPLDFSDGIAEKNLDVVLKEKDKDAKAEPAPTPAPAPGPTPAPTKPEPAPKPESTDDGGDKASADKGSADKGGTGFLNINSLPVSRILVDGQPMGETPKTGVQVSAGTHTITFINPDLPKKSISVTVKAGETKTASAKLRAD